MLRTANISSVPMPFSRVDRKHVRRAPWCIMWKPTMNTSQTGSCTARLSISLVKSTIGFSVMPMCLILPLRLLLEQRRRERLERVVVVRASRRTCRLNTST